MRKTHIAVLAVAVPFALAARPVESTHPVTASGARGSGAAAASNVARPTDLTISIQGPAIVGADCPCYNYEADITSSGTPPFTYQWQDGSTGDGLSNYNFADTGGINFTQVVVDVWDATGRHGRGTEVIKVCPFPEFSC